MIINGIIAEFNPFHNGHAYLCKQAKQLTNADYTVVVMSGNFVQRGAPAVADKYVRARMALTCGADLVIELPTLYATASAEYFAGGAVALLDNLGAVTNLCFGSESGDIAPINQTAQLLVSNPPPLQEAIAESLKSGLSYPAARASAIMKYQALHDNAANIDTLLSNPNNILGIEYCKAIIKRNSKILPATIKRMGAGYHESELYSMTQNSLLSQDLLPSDISSTHNLLLSDMSPSKSSSMANTPILGSATSIRKALTDGVSFSSAMPTACAEILKQSIGTRGVIDESCLDDALFYQLNRNRLTGYTAYLDVTEDLSNKIQKHLNEYTGFESFCEILKSKELTYTRIKRALLHILLEITGEQMQGALLSDYVSYARVLGFRKDASALLHEIKAHATIPLLTKPADAREILSDQGYSSFLKQLLCDQLYYGLCKNWNSAPDNEFKRQIVII